MIDCKLGLWCTKEGTTNQSLNSFCLFKQIQAQQFLRNVEEHFFFNMKGLTFWINIIKFSLRLELLDLHHIFSVVS